ncbi:ABC transporter substrate-binding protein [Polaromonas hydrogenivorans]|uniref:ABC transporter substrate-binding protein n=1 Tax=Polaromonas hydrogenivorans TaxID=335476 RepID=A0AAU7M013_9BURK
MKMNRRQIAFGLAGSLVGAGMLTHSAWAQSTPIKIGVITQLTGFAQIYGEANKIGAEIASQRINAAGGINGRPIEIVLRDDKGSPDGTIAAYRDLVSAGVKLFVAGPVSGTVVALAPLLKGTDHILMAAGPNNLAITHELYNANVFRLQLTSVPVFEGLGVVLGQKAPEVRNWIAISSDQQANQELSRIFLNSLKKFHANKGVNITVQAPVLSKAGAGDFRAQISQIVNSGATGVLNALVGSDSLTFYKQAKAFGLDQKMQVFVDVSANLSSMSSIATSTPKSVWSPNYWYPQGDTNNTVSQAVYKLAVEKTGSSYPFGFVAFAHDAVVAIAEAIKAAKTTETKSLIAAIEAGSPLGAAGPIVFRKADHTYTGEMTYVKFGADPTAKDGIKVSDVVKLQSKDYMEPATPGQKFTIE